MRTSEIYHRELNDINRKDKWKEESTNEFRREMAPRFYFLSMMGRLAFTALSEILRKFRSQLCSVSIIINHRTFLFLSCLCHIPILNNSTLQAIKRYHRCVHPL
jgi:hypothetical protein